MAFQSNNSLTTSRPFRLAPLLAIWSWRRRALSSNWTHKIVSSATYVWGLNKIQSISLQILRCREAQMNTYSFASNNANSVTKKKRKMKKEKNDNVYYVETTTIKFKIYRLQYHYYFYKWLARYNAHHAMNCCQEQIESRMVGKSHNTPL